MRKYVVLKMADGSSFLMADDGTDDRIVIFAGEKRKESLKSVRMFDADGT